MSNTTSNTNTTNTTNTTKSLTAKAIALSIASHSTNHGAFTHMIRALSSATTGRAKIANAALILLDEQRTLLATAKQFESFEHYQTALLDRIESKQAGAKNELKNAAGIKAGNKEVCNFYSLINAALKGDSKLDKSTNKLTRTGCASNHAPDGYKLAFDLENNCFNVEKFVKKQPVKAASSENNPIENSSSGKNSDDSPGETANKNDKTIVLADNVPVFSLNQTLEQLLKLKIEDVQTLASTLVNSTDDKFITLCSAIEHALNVKSETQVLKAEHENDLTGLEIAASKASKELMQAKDHGANTSKLVVKRLEKVSKAANMELVNCKNTISMSAKQY